MNIRLKKSLCSLGLLSILLSFTADDKRFELRNSLPETYNILYDQIQFDNTNFNINNNDATFSDSIINSLNIPFMNRFVPQGLTIIDEKILISAYDFFGNNKSRIYVIDMNGQLLNVCDLDIVAHVGGIAYDIDHNLVWVSNTNGKVNAYSPYTILNNNKASAKYKDLDLGHDLINYKNDPAISYLTYYDNKLYVGNYTKNNNGTLKEYNITINRDNKASLKLNNKYNVPSLIQGVTFYDYNDNRFIIFSRSYGLNTPSILQIFKFDKDKNDYLENDTNCCVYEAPTMMEQIVTYDDELYTIYESGSTPYSSFSYDPTNSVHISDINKLVLNNKRY